VRLAGLESSIAIAPTIAGGRKIPPVDFAPDADYAGISAEAGKLAARFDDDYWLEHDDKKLFPWEFYDAFAQAGWVGVLVPEEYGGAGLGVMHAGALLRAVAGSAGAMNGTPRRSRRRRSSCSRAPRRARSAHGGWTG